MGRGKAITALERGKIQAYHADGKSTRYIAAQLHRSQKLVTDCLQRGPEKEPRRSCGRKRKLSPQDERLIARHASNQQVSANQIIEDLDLDVSKATIIRCLDRQEHLEYKHYRKRPKLAAENVSDRKAFAQGHITWQNQWKNIIFSDEKAFNLDGPDGWSSYWHDLRKEEIVFSKRKFAGGSVKVWVGFSHSGKANLGIFTGAFTSKKYISLLSLCLEPFYRSMEEETDENILFQQDNDSRNVSQATLQWLEEHGILLLGWPANSPDLSPAENIFSSLSRAVYKNNHHYNNKKELQNALIACWDSLSQEVIQNTINSMNDRMIAVIAAHG